MDFMGGFHNSMIALENRVRGLERVVQNMAQDLTGSLEPVMAWLLERFLSSDSYSYDTPRNGHMGSSRRCLVDIRSPTSENDGDQVGNRRAWDKGSGPLGSVRALLLEVSGKLQEMRSLLKLSGELEKKMVNLGVQNELLFQN
ncbi:hypothetical protein GIB67_032762 [Kingdonia uniflora]|uniref:Uncharacterized protein n=1 Tax=Kingdonia uniflora TaxID=39325 RepID=A0A7J7MW58_9MAGN|nr:hypothetical protein GIB67_032762 [Kingdonia uniflora]